MAIRAVERTKDKRIRKPGAFRHACLEDSCTEEDTVYAVMYQCTVQ